MKKVLFGLLSLTLIVATSCKKSKDAPALTKENVAGTYILEKVTAKVNGGAEQDITSDMYEDCEKDDEMTFNVDFTFNSHDAGTECSGDYSGTWALPAANKFEFDGTVYDVANWDGTRLAYSQTSEQMGITGTVTFYIKKK